MPHVFLFIFLPSHVVFLLALLCPPWSSLVPSVPASHAPFPMWNGREGKRWLAFRNRFDASLFTLKNLGMLEGKYSFFLQFSKSSGKNKRKNKMITCESIMPSDGTAL